MSDDVNQNDVETVHDKPEQQFVICQTQDTRSLVEGWDKNYLYWTTKQIDAITFTEAEKEETLKKVMAAHPHWEKKIKVRALK